jgi:hypothetical protein
MKKPRVLMADDHSLILAGLRKLVEPAAGLPLNAGVVPIPSTLPKAYNFTTSVFPVEADRT